MHFYILEKQRILSLSSSTKPDWLEWTGISQITFKSMSKGPIPVPVNVSRAYSDRCFGAYPGNVGLHTTIKSQLIAKALDRVLQLSPGLCGSLFLVLRNPFSLEKAASSPN